MEKRGISAIVATVLIILVTVAGISIIWIGILPMVNLEESFTESEVELNVITHAGYTAYDSSSDIAMVQVKRKFDESHVEYMKVIFDVGGNSIATIVEAPSAGETKTYYFDFSGQEAPTEVRVLAILENGEEGDVTSSKIPSKALVELPSPDKIIGLGSDASEFCEVEAEICDDLIDNDCDGFVDLEDSDCDEEVLPTCTDGVQNGDETGIDCGGSCEACPTVNFCGDGNCEGSETISSCVRDCHPEFTTDIYTSFDDWQIWEGEFEGVDASDRTFLISPVIDVGANNEQLHHYITVNYSGTGRVKHILGHHSINDLDSVMSQSYRTNGEYWMESGRHKYVSSQYRQERYSWIILELEGDVEVERVGHSYWIGEDTVYGHKAEVFNFEEGYLPYRILYPNHYDPSKSYALVVSASGSDGLGFDNVRQMTMTSFGRFYFEKYYLNDEFEAFSIVPQIPCDTTHCKQDFYSVYRPNNIDQYFSEYIPNVDTDYFPHTTLGIDTQKYDPSLFGLWMDKYNAPLVNKDGFYAEAVNALVDSMIADPSIKIDTSRIYLTGYSYGGKATYELMEQMPDTWAVAWPVAGWAIGGSDDIYYNYDEVSYVFDSKRDKTSEYDEKKAELSQIVQSYKHIPIRLDLGTEDVIAYQGLFFNEIIQEEGGNCIYDLHPVSHTGVPSKAYGTFDNMRWFFSQGKR